MLKGFAVIVLITMIAGSVSVMMLGWIYEGPRRLIVRLKGGKI